MNLKLGPFNYSNEKKIGGRKTRKIMEILFLSRCMKTGENCVENENEKGCYDSSLCSRPVLDV